jgi:hypothetical protein
MPVMKANPFEMDCMQVSISFPSNMCAFLLTVEIILLRAMSYKYQNIERKKLHTIGCSIV